MKINGIFVLREIMDEFILVPVGEAMLSLNGMFALNPVGAEIWKMLEKESNREEIIQRILDTFEVDEKTAREDFDAFISELSCIGLIV